jgi:hypothetical protein
VTVLCPNSSHHLAFLGGFALTSPVAFEILGMLSKTLRLKNSCFRVVPNPTFYVWDKKYFSMRKLLREFKNKIIDDDLVSSSSPRIGELQNEAEAVDNMLTESGKKSGENAISLELLDTLHRALDSCDEYLTHKVRGGLVGFVLREHIQEVLKMVNGEDVYSSRLDDQTQPDRDTRQRLRFDDLMTAPPEERQATFMDIYFAVILPRVVELVAQALRRSRQSTLHVPGHHHGQGSSSSVGSAAGTPSRSPTPVESNAISSTPHVQLPPEDERGHRGANMTEQQATDVWCTLVFRMLCWLLMHDFHKKDVQKSKSELIGSRLPVYVA